MRLIIEVNDYDGTAERDALEALGWWRGDGAMSINRTVKLRCGDRDLEFHGRNLTVEMSAFAA
jgi:hypothetical protein